MPATRTRGLLEQLRQRGVVRVAASYAVIGWLLLQIADVTFDPLGLPKWVMTALIVAVALGFPVSVLLAWFFEIGDHGITRDSATGAAPRPQVHGVRRYADVAIIGVLVVVVAILLVRQSDFGKPPPPGKPALAVLPFANLSADPEQTYFSDGLAEEVLDRLGQVPGLMVVARSSSFQFRNKQQDVREVAQKLGVNAVLEGAVRRDGKRLKLSAKLIDGATGYQLWSGSFDREVNDVFAVQAELAQAVIDAIVPVARGDTPVDMLKGPPPTISLSAYDLYLLGRAKANTRWSNTMQKAAEYFEQALEQDPKFAKAQAALALVRVYQINDDELQGISREARIELAEAAVYKALALEPKSSDALVAQANLLRNARREGVEDAYRRALAVNPNNADGWHGYALFLGDQRARRKETEAATRRAHELDPLNIGPLRNFLGLILRPGAVELRQELESAKARFAGEPDTLRSIAPVLGSLGYPVDAWKIVVQTRNDPAFTVPRSTSAVGPVGLWMYVDPEYVVAHAERFLQEPELSDARTWLLGMLLTAHGRLGHEQDVRRLLDEYAAITGPDDLELNAYRAFWFSVFGHQQEAAAALVKMGQLPAPELGASTLGGGIETGQSLPAWLRTLRASGRQAEAQALLDQEMARFRSERPQNPDEGFHNWAREAGVAANEGRRADAIRHLQQAMRWSDTPIGFAPELPWFRSLEGDPAYDALLKELRKRVAAAREQMLALDVAPPAR